jgi:hypothetical protein
MSIDEMRQDLVRVVRQYARSNDDEPLLLRVAAGGGKTYSGILIAQALAKDGYRVMWAASRHEMFNELWIANDIFDGELWYHWRPMTYTTPNDVPLCRYAEAQTIWLKRGYRSFGLCQQLCQADSHIKKCLYRKQGGVKQPVIFAMHQHLASGMGINKDFDVALVDELPMGAFLDQQKVPVEHLVLDATGPLQDLGEKLQMVASYCNSRSDYVSGKKLFEIIGPTLTDAFAQVEVNDNAIPKPPTIRRPSEVFDVPHFWIMRFLLIAEQEWQCWRNDWDVWVERLRINAEELTMLWRQSPWGKLPNKLVALDATSRPEMYERLFDYEPVVTEPEVDENYEPPPLGF